jgi:hypothetical protein
MFDNEFDELFRSRLKDHPSAVPEDMWQRIVGKTEGRRGLSMWWWLPVTGAFVLITAVIFREHASKVLAVHQDSAAIGSFATTKSYAGKPAPTGPAQPYAVVPAKPYTVVPAKPGIPASADLVPEKPFATTPAAPKPAAPKPATPYTDGPAASKPAGTFDQTHSVSEPAILRSGFGPRSPSGPGFFSARGGAGYWLPNVEPLSLAFSSPYANRPNGKPIPCPDPEHLEVNSGWFLEAYFSPDILFTSQRQGFSWSAGARLGKTFNGRFSATIGLAYSHIVLQGYIDSFPVQPFNSLDLPVILGYQLAPGDQFSTTIHAGLIWNLHYWPVGTYYGMPYNNNTGLAFYFGFDFLKPVSSRWSIFTEPHFRYQLSNRSANLMQSPDLGGLSLGVRYNFTRRGGVR